MLRRTLCRTLKMQRTPGDEFNRHLSTALPVHVRYFADADRPAVAACQIESWTDTYSSVASAAYMDSLDDTVNNRWRDIVFGPHEFVLVASEPPEPHACNAPLGGFITVLDRKSYAFVDNMHVALAHRRRGVGRALMAAAARQLQRHGYDRMRLNVLENNDRARAFYGSLGGVEVARPVMSFVGSQLQAIVLEWSHRSLHNLAGLGHVTMGRSIPLP